MQGGFEAQHRLIVNNAIVGVFLFQDDKFWYVNPALAKIFGYQPEEIMEKLGPLDLTHPDHRNLVTKQIQRRLRGEVEHARYTFRGLRKDGSSVYCEVFGSRINYRERPAIVGTLVDITKRRKAEEALKESEERHRSLMNDVMESSDMGIFILDADFKVVWINKATERFFGLRREEVIGKDKRGLVKERMKHIFDNPRRFADKVLAAYEDNTYIESFECHVLPGPGREERWLEHWSQPIRTGFYAGGRIEHYYDATNRRKAQEALQESEERYHDLVENIGDLIQSVAPDGRILYANRAWRETLGYGEDEIGTLSLFDVIHPDSQANCAEVFQRVLSGERVDRIEAELITKDGRKVIVEGNASCKFVDGEPVHTRAIFRDVTEHKRSEKALESYAHHQQILAELGQMALADIGLEALFDLTVNLVARTLRVEYCKILELLPQGDAMLLVAGVGWKKGLVGKAKVGCGRNSQAGYTLLSSEPVIVDDLST